LELGEQAEQLAALVGAQGGEDLFEEADPGGKDALEVGAGGGGELEEGGAAVGGVGAADEEAVAFEAIDHVGDGSRGDAEVGGEVTHAKRAALVDLYEDAHARAGPGGGEVVLDDALLDEFSDSFGDGHEGAHEVFDGRGGWRGGGSAAG
jgi:hypothetical protein